MIQLIHIVFGFSSLIFGLYVLCATKGTKRHKAIGKLYVISMVLLNATAFGIYELFDGFGIFHWAAIISSMTILGGIGVLMFRRKFKNWVSLHYELMVWSYIGLLAATSNEAFVHIPVLQDLAKTHNYAPLVAMIFIFLVGSRWETQSKQKLTNQFRPAKNN